MRREHAGESLGFEYLAVLAAAAGQQRRHVAGHVGGGGVDAAGAGGHQIAVAHRARTAGSQGVPGREPGPDPVGPGQVGAGHAERPEDAVAEDAASGWPVTSSTIWPSVANPWLL